ncbi:MAG: hypothetical protein ACLQLC_07465 [Candidatus Sulfotelmatobacter sp.]
MRITSFRVTPVARVLAIIYGIFGLTYVPTLFLLGAKQMILPVGIVAPLVFLNLNLRFALPSHFLTGVLSVVAASLCYAVTGGLTGAAAVLAFNFVAGQLGGIEASVLVKSSSTPGASSHLSPE